MADQTVAGGDAVQTGDHAFEINGSQSGEITLPNNLSVAEADFSMDGSDLVMTFPDGTTVTVEGYADNPNPPTLVSSDGAQVGHDVVTALTMDNAGTDAAQGSGPFGFVQPEEPAAAHQSSGNIAENPNVIAGTDGEPIGNVESLNGEVFAIRADGSRVRLELGDQVFQGDILESGPEGNVGVLLADQTTFAMGPEGRMVLDEMIYDPATQQGSVSMSVLQGVFTFVSGQVAKTDPDAMTLDTPVATIGIRGTQVGLDLRDGENLNVHLMEERFGFVGEVVIVNDGGVQVLNDANAFSSISSFDSAPSPFSIVAVDDIINSYGEQTLRYLPTRNSDGERTSANTYQDAQDVQGENRDSLNFLNDFQTDAGGPQQGQTQDIKVTGELQKLNIIDQAKGNLNDANKFVEEKEIKVEEKKTGPVEIEKRVDTITNDESVAEEQLPGDLKALEDAGILTNITLSADKKTVTADVPGDFDAGDLDYTFVLTGDDGDNVITGGDGDDTLRGAGGNDILIGGDGDDLFIAAPGLGDDTYDGGAGNDTITFAASDDDLIINLSNGTASDGRGADGIGSDTILNIENVIGGSGNDTIIGDDYDNILRGGAGDDFIDGRGGQDTAVFSGTYGQSTIRIVDGVLTVTGPDGVDTIENVENFAFTDSPNLIVGLEDTAMSVDVAAHVPVAGSATSVIITGVPAGAVLSAGTLLENGSWLLDNADLEGLTLTGATNSADDFSINIAAYGADYLTAITEAVSDYLGDQLNPLTNQPLQTLEDFLAGGGSVLELAGTIPQSYLPQASGTGSVGIEVIGIVDPFSVTMGGVELTADGSASTITFAGTEDTELPLNIMGTLTDTDGSEVLSVTLSGLPTLEVHQVSYEVPLLDENGAPLLDEEGVALTETQTVFEPVTDANGNTVGAHLIYTDASGNDVVLPANDTGTYTLTAAQLNNLRLVGSPDDSAGFDLEISAQVQDGESTATVFGTASVVLAAKADVPTVNGGAEAGIEDQPVNISFDIDKNDISEHITKVTLTGIPAGSKLTIEYTDPDTGETMHIQLPVQNGSATIPIGFLGEDMSTDGLTLTPPPHLSGSFNLQLNVTSTEPTNGDTAINNFNMPLTLTAVADELGVTINNTTVVDGDVVNISAQEDGAFALDITALTADKDGSEVISVTISGVPAGAILSAGTVNSDGSWTLTPEEFAGLTITPAPNSDVNFDLTVTVTNVDNNEDTITLEATVSVDVAAIADAANLTAANALGLEDTPIPLDIASSLNDTDGSESLSITISGVPEGAVLSAGIDNGGGSWTLTPEQLDGLTITPGLHVSGEFNLTVSATTTEAANGDTATVTQQIGLSITPDPDAPIINVTSITGNEDTAIPLNIDAALVDQDGSETLSISIAGVPEGAILSAGTNLGNGVWDVSPADLANLTITPPANSNVDFNLTVTATATESNGEFIETTAEIPVTVLGVADDPTLVANEVIGLEGTPIPLNISATLNDTDGSENLSITIANIPQGAFLLSGGNVIAIQDGVATLTGEQLADLTILPPNGSDEDFDLLVTATSTENDNDITANGQGVSSVSGTLSVVVHEQADPPALMLFNASGNEDMPVPLNIAAILTDPEETLSVTVSGIPEGVTLSAGTHNDDGTWTLEAGDLQGLTMTLPQNSSADFTLQVTATSTTDDGTFAEKSGSMTVSVAGVADAANLNLTDVAADEGTPVPLNIDASLVDTDGSETLSITLSNIPEGSVLTNALGSVLTIVGGAVELTSDQLEGLTLITPPGMDTDFTLLVTATTTEDDAGITGNGQGVASVSGVINVDMQAVAEVPTLVLQDASGNEDLPIALDISAIVSDPSETVSITIAGVPAGAMLSAGSNNNDGTWTLTPAQLEGLTITPPANSNENFQLEITATSTEQDGTQASSSGSISIGVTGVADAPTLNTGNVSGLEDGAIPLNISANLNDTDGSETLSITIEGVPAGAQLSAGVQNADGSWTLSGDQLSGLTMAPPADASGNFSLMVTATSTENDGDSSSVTGLMNINVGAVADAPTLILHDAAGFEDDAIPLEISTSANGGDEIVGITISGVPAGATLSAGTANPDGTWTLSAGDLDGLKITPPENSNVNFNLSVTVTSMDGDDLAETTQAMNVSVTAVADKPTLDVPAQVAVEGSVPVDLNIHGALNDLDGSETLSINISNIPEGAILNIGSTVLTVVGGSINLQPSQLSGLQITPPPGFDGNFTLQVTATATDTDPDNVIPTGLETSVSIGFIDVEVDGIVINTPDAPDLVLEDTLGYEDSPIALDIDAALTDASETLSITISGVPAGAVLSAGTDLGNGTWSLLPEEAVGLTITPPSDSNVDFPLTVTATSTTPEGDFATTTGIVNVDVIGVADQPNLSATIGDPISVPDTTDLVITNMGQESAGYSNSYGFFVMDAEGNPTTGMVIWPDTKQDIGDTFTLEGVDPASIGFFVIPNGGSNNPGLGGQTEVTFHQDAGGNWIATGPDGNDLVGSGDPVLFSKPSLNEGNFDYTTDNLSVGNQNWEDLVGGGDQDFNDININVQAIPHTGSTSVSYPLEITSSLNDTDGSETLSITISDLPAGVTLSAGEQIDDGTWVLTPEQLTGLTITVPLGVSPDFDFQITATATENDGDTASVSTTVGVDGDDLAEAPELSVSAAAGNEDSAIALDISAALTDTDGSETLSITISGMPEGAELSAGINNGDGSWTLSPDQLTGLTVTPPENSDTDFTLTVAATSREASTGDTAVTTGTLAVAVNAIADAPDVAAGDGDGDVGQTVPLNIQSVLNDTDGSESLSITIAGFPAGASLNAGTDNGDGSYTLSVADLDGLAISLPEGSSSDFDLTVTATSTEQSNNDQASTVVTASINVDPQANDDRNMVEIGEVTSGNVLTGQGDSANPQAAADVGTAQGNSVVDVSFGGVTKSFSNPDDVQSDADGNYIEIAGEHGTLKMYDDGSYDYAADENESVSHVAGLTGTASSGAVEEAWSGVQTFAFGFGTSYVDGNGKFNPSLADGQISYTGNGIGVAGTQNGMPAPDQINHNNVTGESEALAINLGGVTNSATLTVSNMFNNEDGGEQGHWQAFDAAGNLVGEGVLNASTVNYGNSNNVGTAEISLPDGASFQYLVFTATDTGNDSNRSDSSDFFIRAVQFETNTNEVGEDVFSYTMQDADGDTASATLSINVSEEQDRTASDPTLNVSDAAGLEDGAIALDIAAGLGDIDGSETLSITIGGVPEGAVLSAGTNNNDGTWTVSPNDLGNLTITPPANSNVDFSLTVTATSTEANGGDTSTTTATINVDVTGVADTPGATATNQSGVEDQWIELHLDSAMSEDTDGSETLSITISGVPEGAQLNAGTQVSPGVWSVPAADLPNVSILPPANFAGEMSMALSVTATEDDGDTATTQVPFTVSVSGDADAPTVTIGDAAGLEDTAIALDISAVLGDTDGSESLSITISGVPSGAVLSAGINNNDGTWTLSGEQLDGLTVTPPHNSNVDMSLSVSATATEANGDTATTTATMNVAVTGVADAPTLNVAIGQATVTTTGGAVVETTINSSNVTDSGNGFSVSGRSINPDGTLAEASTDNISFNTNPVGFGVSGAASGADTELGFDNAHGVSEELIVSFDQPASSADVSFAWMHPGEHATYELYLNGVKVGEGQITGISDAIDPPVTFTADGGSMFDQIVFSAPGAGDDFLINSISFDTVQGGETLAEYPLDISSSLTDTDGSETLSITVGGLPEGAQLSAGSQNGDGTWTLTPGQLAGLTMTVAAGIEDFQLSVTATSTENDGDTASVSLSVDVGVPSADQTAEDPNLSVNNVTGDEDTAIALDIASSLSDTDGSESLSITISGVPEGAVLSAGTNNNDGTWTLEQGDLDGLTVTPPANSNVDFTLTVTATSTESATGDTATQTASFTVDVTGVADTPGATATNQSGVEDQWIQLHLDSAMSEDTDGSETLSITISGVPEGAQLNAGTQVSPGVWSVPAADLPHVSILPPANFAGEMSMALSVTATEDDGDTATTQVPFTVSVSGDADAPTVTIGDVAGLEDTAIALDISAVLGDTDGSESLSITISGVPTGAVLSAGINNNDGTWTLNGEQLDGLTVTPPHNSNVDMSLSVSATATEANGDTATTTATMNVAVTGVADAPTLNVSIGEAQISTVETGTSWGDMATTSAATSGGDDTIVLSGMNQNQSINLQGGNDLLVINGNTAGGNNINMAGGNDQVVFNGNIGGNTSVNGAGGDDVVMMGKSSSSYVVSNLTNNNGKISAQITDSATGQVLTVNNVEALAFGDGQVIGNANIVQWPDAASETVVSYDLDISSSLTDTDGSESLSITVGGLPNGAILSAGTKNNDGTWTLNAGELQGLKVSVSGDNAGNALNLTVSATSTENDGDTATVSQTVSTTAIETDLSADGTNLTAHSVSGSEDTAIALDIAASLNDTDGSESLSITISGVPTGAVLSAGTNNNDGTWTLQQGDLSGLTVTPPANSNVDFTLSVTATSTESASGETSTQTASFTVDVTGVADTPMLNVAIGTGVETPASSDITITNMGEISAGYNNSYGYYVKDADGNPGEGMVIWPNAKDNVGDTFTIEGVDPDSIGFFIIPNGGGNNSGLGVETPVTFTQDQSGNWHAVGPNGQRLVSSEGTLMFDDPSLNAGNFDYTVDNATAGNQNWEDLRGGGDRDFNDVNVNVAVTDHIGSGTVEYPLNITSSLTDTDGSESLSITVGGLPESAQLSAGTENNDGTWTLTPGQLAGLTMTVAAGIEDFQLTVTATSTENDGDTASVSVGVDVVIPETDGAADGVDLSAGNVSGNEDTAIALNIASSLHDTDGSESLSITISGVPNGAVLSAGTNNNDGTWTLGQGDLDGLTVTPPTNSNVDFTLTVTATGTESDGGAASSQTASFTVDVSGVADTPTLSALSNFVTEAGGETSVPVPNSILQSASGSRQIRIEGITNGETLSAGTNNGDGTWTLTPAQLSGLSVTPGDGSNVSQLNYNFIVSERSPAGQTLVSENFNSGPSGWGNSVGCTNGKMDIDYNDTAAKTFDFGVGHAGQTVTISFEATGYGGWDTSGSNRDYLQVSSNGQQILNSSSSGTTHTLTVTLDGNGRAALQMKVSTTASEEGMLIDNFAIKTGNGWERTIATESASFDVAPESMVYELDITSALTDLDGSESLSITVDGFPEGASLSAGQQNGDGSWTLSPGQLAGLTYSVPVGHAAFTIAVVATSTENDGDTATTSVNLPVAGHSNDNAADGVNLSAGNASGNEDTAIALNIASTLNDTDGSESLSITISGVPSGAVLSAGTNNNDGTWTLGQDDLDGLTIMPPADSNEDFTLSVSATGTESQGGETATQTASFNVAVTGVADGASVSATATMREGHGAQTSPSNSTGSGSGHGSHHGSGSGSGEGSDLVAFFEVSEDDDNGEIDNSVGKNDGELHGVVINNDSNGPSGSSAVFDGNNDYVEVDHKKNLEMDSGTFVLWFNTDDAEDKQGLFSKDSNGYDDGGHITAFVDDGQLQVRLQSTNSSYMVQGGDVSSGSWHQMAFSFGSNGMNLYLDGQLVDHDNYSGGLSGNEEPLVFGANQWSSGNEVANNLQDFFKGQMDKIAVYDRALSVNEIATMHQAGVEQMNNGAEAQVYDLDIEGTLVDVDGSETLSFEIRGLPEGVTLSAGLNDGNGTWALSAADLAGLTMTVNPSVSDDFSIEVVAIGTENDGDSAESPIVTLDIAVAVADPVEINGTWSDESLSGASGNDTISGGDGNDQLYGHSGDDILDGGTGNDSLFGDAGDDVMDGGHGNDVMYGGTGNDTMDGGSDNDTMDGGAGNDEMFGGWGDDVMVGGAGNDMLDGSGGHDTISGGDGNDQIDGGSGNDQLYGGAGNDVISGGDGNDTIHGGAGDDVLTGGWGEDKFVMDGGSGHDIIQDIMENDSIVFEGQEFHAEDMIFNENEDGDVVVSFAGVEGQSVTLNGVSMDDLDRNGDGDPSEGYSVTESDGNVTLTIDS